MQSASPPALSSSFSPRSSQTPPSPQSALAISPRNGSTRGRVEGKERGNMIQVEEDEGKKVELLDDLTQRLLSDIQDVHNVRKLLSSFYKPLTGSGIQIL